MFWFETGKDGDPISRTLGKIALIQRGARLPTGFGVDREIDCEIVRVTPKTIVVRPVRVNAGWLAREAEVIALRENRKRAEEEYAAAEASKRAEVARVVAILKREGHRGKAAIEAAGGIVLNPEASIVENGLFVRVVSHEIWTNIEFQGLRAEDVSMEGEKLRVLGFLVDPAPYTESSARILDLLSAEDREAAMAVIRRWELVNWGTPEDYVERIWRDSEKEWTPDAEEEALLRFEASPEGKALGLVRAMRQEEVSRWVAGGWTPEYEDNNGRLQGGHSDGGWVTWTAYHQTVVLPLQKMSGKATKEEPYLPTGFRISSWEKSWTDSPEGKMLPLGGTVRPAGPPKIPHLQVTPAWREERDALHQKRWEAVMEAWEKEVQQHVLTIQEKAQGLEAALVAQAAAVQAMIDEAPKLRARLMEQAFAQALAEHEKPVPAPWLLYGVTEEEILAAHPRLVKGMGVGNWKYQGDLVPGPYPLMAVYRTAYGGSRYKNELVAGEGIFVLQTSSSNRHHEWVGRLVGAVVIEGAEVSQRYWKDGKLIDTEYFPPRPEPERVERFEPEPVERKEQTAFASPFAGLANWKKR